jgi:AraC-like DNA-binding protein
MTIAERSGYESEATFSRAFKREFGLPPALWRRTENLQASRQERQS